MYSVSGGTLRTFYRVVKTAPPKLEDFLSNTAKGWPPRGVEIARPELWEGLSVYDSEANARRKARQVPVIGSHIAKVELPAETSFKYEKTGGRGHYTLWAEAQTLLDNVVEIVPVEQEEQVR